MASPSSSSGPTHINVQEEQVQPGVFTERCNTSTEALGKVRRLRMCGLTNVYLSSGWWAYIVTTTVTFLIVYGNLFVTSPHLGTLELGIFWSALAVAHYASFRLLTSDPGVYPRLAAGEADPLAHEMTYVFCRVCRMRRPPRTSHCYECNVCVLEHDHHCGVLGACVGVRNLRWFTLYLVAITSAGIIAAAWQLRYLLFLAFGRDLNHLPPAASTSMNFTNSTSPSDDTVSSVLPPLSLGVLLTDVGVVGLVGTGAVYYTLLTLTDTTRREAQRRETSLSALRQPRTLLSNLRKVAFPPRSLLEEDSRARSRETERWRLV